MSRLHRRRAVPGEPGGRSERGQTRSRSDGSQGLADEPMRVGDRGGVAGGGWTGRARRGGGGTAVAVHTWSAVHTGKTEPRSKNYDSAST